MFTKFLEQETIHWIFGLIGSCILDSDLFVHRISQNVTDEFEPNYVEEDVIKFLYWSGSSILVLDT